MKAYTDLEQSKKLTEILPLESADMYCPNRIGMDNYPLPIEWKNGLPLLSQEIPCWSLAALLHVLPYPTLHQQGDGAWGLDAWVDQVKPYSVNNAICEVDACVEMIIKLNELKML